jgi:hypothetical protein
MKSCSFLAVIVLFSLSANAQSHLKLYLNSGIGKSALSIPDYPSNSEYQSAISDKFRVTCNAQLNFSYRIKNWIMETGLGYNLIQGFTEERVNVYNLFNEFEYMEYSTTEVRRAHYLQLPLTVQYQIKKWSIGGGVYAGYKMTDYSRNDFYLNSIPNGFQQGGNRLTDFDYGLMAKLDYAISEKWGMQVIVNFGLHDVSNGNQKGVVYDTFQIQEATNRRLYNRQFLIGLNYALF